MVIHVNFFQNNLQQVKTLAFCKLESCPNRKLVRVNQNGLGGGQTSTTIPDAQLICIFIKNTFLRSSSSKQNENNKKNNQDHEDFYDEPAVGRDRLEVFQEFAVSRRHIVFSLFDIVIDS
jgi:hypothetical protein